MRRETILTIWLGGLILAAAIYGIGPDRFLDACVTLIDAADTIFREVLITLGTRAFVAVRALTIALYAVFVVLAVLSSRRGQRGIWALIVVTLTVLILVWRPYAGYPAPAGRWIVALVLVLTSAVVMSQRLMRPPPRPGPWMMPPSPRPPP